MALGLWWQRQRGVASAKGVDEWFTDIADCISVGAGRWQTTGFCILLFFAWLALGPHMAWSDTWQLVANTPTTWVELYLGLFMLAAANRVEKRNRELHEQILAMAQHIDRIVVHLDIEVDQICEAVGLETDGKLE